MACLTCTLQGETEHQAASTPFHQVVQKDHQDCSMLHVHQQVPAKVKLQAIHTAWSTILRNYDEKAEAYPRLASVHEDKSSSYTEGCPSSKDLHLMHTRVLHGHIRLRQLTDDYFDYSSQLVSTRKLVESGYYVTNN
jgi:hypothetical protein